MYWVVKPVRPVHVQLGHVMKIQPNQNVWRGMVPKKNTQHMTRQKMIARLLTNGTKIGARRWADIMRILYAICQNKEKLR